MKEILKIVLALSLVAGAHVARASGVYVQPLGESFMEERAAVLEGLESGRFETLTPEDRAKVLRLLEEIAVSVEGVDNIREIPPDGRTRLLNAEREINALLTSADPDQRVVCRRERAVGSHFKTQRCATVAEWRMINNISRQKMEQRQNGRLCNGGPCRPGG